MKKGIFLALLALFATTAQADGNVFYSATHNFGSTVLAEGFSAFEFQSGFQGGAYTNTGISQIGGGVFLQSNAFVPIGMFGTASAGGNIFHSTEAGHQAGMPFSLQSSSLNTWSSSSGAGNASSSLRFDASTLFQPTISAPSVGEKG